MKVTLINPRENYDVVLPMGILYIGTVLDLEGHSVQILDIGPRDQGWLEKVKNFQPNIIGLTLVTTQYERAKEILNLLKPILPQAKYCAGGVHPSALPKETLQDLDLDFVVIGEGEYVMKEVCEKILRGKSLTGIKGICYKNGEEIICNERAPVIADLDQLPMPKRELMPDDKWYLIPPGFIRGSFNKGIATIMSGRGCPYNCLFCASHNVFGRGMHRRSPENVIKEIQYLKNNYKIKGLFFLDDTFTVNKVWLKEFCELLKKENLIWSCQARGDTIDEEILKIMRDAGCVQIDIGSESGNDLVLEKLNKLEHVKDLRRAFNIARKLGVKTFTSFIVGNPGESWPEIEDTKKFALEVKPDMAVFCILVPYPGTTVYELAKQNNWFTEASKIFSIDWANKQSEHPVMAINFTPAELIKIRADLENLFLWQNHKIIILSFLKNPRYLGQLLISMVKNTKATLKALLQALKTQKLRLFMEETYQNFSYEMKIKLAKKH